MSTTLSLTNTYWEMLKSLSDDVKLQLAQRLTASVAHTTDDQIPCDYSLDELEKHVFQGVAEARQGYGKSNEELMAEAELW